ncbi:MAG: penicillin acylase family protein, partial [Caulobacteraceae bacterium]
DWVVDGRRSATGAPILENDPHIALTAPSTWYLASVEGGGLNLTGAFVAGDPFMAFGHNARVGWGVTETGGDVEDLFVEKVDPADPNLYLTPAGWRPFLHRRETIDVRGGRPVTLDVRLTDHGPVISDALKGEAKARYVVSLEANFLQAGDKTPQALWEMDQAQNWPQFLAALRDYGAPQVSIVYADVGGTIAFIAAGRAPIREGGDGWAPTPGWTGEGDWAGYIPFDALPRSVDPRSGRLLSANNDITAAGYPYFLSRGWAAPFRAVRIAALLDAAPVQSLGSTSAMTADTVSLAARQLVPLLLRARPENAGEARAQSMLAGWNGDMAADLPQPLIFEAWVRRLERDLFQATLGEAFDDYWSAKPRVLAPMLAGPLGCRPGSSCAPVVARSLGEALAMLRGRYGDDPSRWRWGEAHRADFANLVLGQAPAIGPLVSPRTPAGGGVFTIDAGDMNFANRKAPFGDDLGPGLRMVLDFSDLANSRFLLAPGESENLVSPHYADLLERWRTFRWMVLAKAPIVGRLVLEPT